MSGGRGRALLALAAGALLAGCASSQQASEEPEPAAVVAAAPAIAPDPDPNPAPPAPSPPSASPADAVPTASTARKPSAARSGVVLSAAARAAAGASATPRQLVGLGRDDVQDLFGQPFLLKREGEAELWQYRAPACVLDVFLYAGKDGGQRVTHAELRARRENARPPAGCYTQILNAPRPAAPQQTAKG
ncbi:MAG: hypothetical protein IT562_09240 [Alphaproteobacteria bacterium]|nr:hypothetical protein [Alphaproteobacteria bacterium]